MPHARQQRRTPVGFPRTARRKGFTLIELLTVIAVVALLTMITVGGISGVKNRANIARAKSDLAALATALEEYKRHYGEYPYLGPPDYTQATLTPANPTTGPGMGTVQAKLFNALTGVFGPRALANANRVNGPTFLDVGRFSRQPAALPLTFQVPVVPGPGQPPVKQEQNIGLLDPWGRYYVYYYKSARNPNNWQATGYLLYSVGPDGAHTPPANTGILTPAQRNAVNNADNIHANL
jgi:prepilin-type N-terminal cleavage/methylation domain-containing protein